MTYALRLAWHWATFALMATLLLLAGTFNAAAFDDLSEAQEWIYDRSHLINTTSGQLVEYSYTSNDDNTQEISDIATLSILQENEDGERRDVEVNFLSDERHLALPPFTGYRGNPMIIAMLEHIAQNIGSQTGGGVLYFRNRIRDSLAGDQVKFEESSTLYGEKKLDTHTLRFSPFENDAYIKSHPLFTQAEFLIEFSDEVPAGIVSISVTAKLGDQKFNRTLSVR